MISEQQALFQTEALSPAASRAKTSRSRANVPVLPDNAPAYIGKLYDWWMNYRQSTSSSKTYLAFCRQTTDETWVSSSGRLLSGGTASAGVCLTLNTSEWPSVAVECSLSDVLETTGPHLAKYSLSAKACEGILRRASRRGKTLPPMLEQALSASATNKDWTSNPALTTSLPSESEVTEPVSPYLSSSQCEKETQGGGKGPLISTDQSLTLATGNGQILIEPAVARMRGFGDYEIDGTMSAVKARDYKDATDLVVGQVTKGAE